MSFRRILSGPFFFFFLLGVFKVVMRSCREQRALLGLRSRGASCPAEEELSQAPLWSPWIKKSAHVYTVCTHFIREAPLQIFIVLSVSTRKTSQFDDTKRVAPCVRAREAHAPACVCCRRRSTPGADDDDGLYVCVCVCVCVCVYRGPSGSHGFSLYPLPPSLSLSPPSSPSPPSSRLTQAPPPSHTCNSTLTPRQPFFFLSF